MRFSTTLRSAFTTLATITIVTLVIIGAISIRLYRSLNIPGKDYLINSANTGLVLTDRHGEVFFEFDKPGRKTIIPHQDIPDHAIKALIAAEDQEFYNHLGFSPRGIARATYLDIKAGQLIYGGSTITQQIAKNILLNPRKELIRKYQEILLAIKLERYFSKQDILDLYLNLAYFGQGAYGLEEAAQTYFAKPAKNLTLSESSLLIGLLPAPTILSPLGDNPQLAQNRQAYVLRRLVEENYITPAEQTAAQNTNLVYNQQPRPQNTIAPHFALMVRDQLLRQFTLEYIIGAGLHIKTTLDLNWQRQAEQSVQRHIATIQPAGATNVSAVAIDPGSGEILALVGSVDWHNQTFGKLNMATAPRQTGSAFKPIVYAAGLEQQVITPSTRLVDRPTTFGTDYQPQNYDRQYRGTVLARYALANSLNIPSVDAISKIGPSSVVTLAQQLGISTIDQQAAYHLATALGVERVSLLELSSAYGAFANNGTHQPTTTIISVKDKHHQPIDLTPPSKPQSALSEQVAFIVSSILSDNQSRLRTFGNSLQLSQPAAAKTGTTQDYRDAWTIGYTPNLVVGVWVGNNDNRPMRNLPGAIGAAPLWRHLMETYLVGLPPTTFTPPSGLIKARICRGSGLLVGNSSAGYEEYFIAGTQPSRYCPTPTPSPTPTP